MWGMCTKISPYFVDRRWVTERTKLAWRLSLINPDKMLCWANYTLSLYGINCAIRPHFCILTLGFRWHLLYSWRFSWDLNYPKIKNLLKGILGHMCSRTSIFSVAISTYNIPLGFFVKYTDIGTFLLKCFLNSIGIVFLVESVMWHNFFAYKSNCHTSATTFELIFSTPSKVVPKRLTISLYFLMKHLDNPEAKQTIINLVIFLLIS